jgi:hypothetical protein
MTTAKYGLQDDVLHFDDKKTIGKNWCFLNTGACFSVL